MLTPIATALVTVPPERVYVVDDDESMRVALTRLLLAAGYQVLAFASAGDFLVEVEDRPSGCLLLDLHMPGPDGLALQDAVLRRGWDLPVVFLSGRGDIRSSVQALKAGAHDFLTKPVDGKTLLQAIGNALAQDAPVRAQRRAERDVRQRLATLNERERAVLRQVLSGALTRDIALSLQVSERTVKSCRAAVMEKLQADSLPDLVRKCAILTPDPLQL